MATPDYCTVSQVREAIPDTSWNTDVYDTVLASLATRASRFIDRLVKKWPGYFAADTDEVRYFDGSGCREQWVDELAAVPTTVGVAQSGQVDSAAGTGGVYTTYAATDYYPWPYNALRKGQPIMRLDLDILYGTQSLWYAYPRGVKITGKFGYSTSTSMPDEIVQVSIVQTMRWFKRGQQAYQDTGAIVELGMLKYAQSLDPDLAQVVEHFMGVTI